MFSRESRKSTVYAKIVFVSQRIFFNLLSTIHKYPKQFLYSYWWRARHVGVFKRLIMTSVYNRLPRVRRARLLRGTQIIAISNSA